LTDRSIDRILQRL